MAARPHHLSPVFLLDRYGFTKHLSYRRCAGLVFPQPVKLYKPGLQVVDREGTERGSPNQDLMRSDRCDPAQDAQDAQDRRGRGPKRGVTYDRESGGFIVTSPSSRSSEERCRQALPAGSWV